MTDRNPTTRRPGIATVPRTDVRYRRAMAVTSCLMHALDLILDEADPEINLHRRVSRAMLETLMAEGVEVLTDLDRHEAGLSPRGPDGWTVEEIFALEKRRLEVMMAPIPPLIVKGPLS